MSGMDAALAVSAAGFAAIALILALCVGLYLWARRRG